MNYLTTELDKFSKNLNEVIKCIETSCENMDSKNDMLIIINKVHFYAQEFFVNNELSQRNNSENLTEIKAAHKDFFSGLKATQIMDANDKKIGLNNLKNYLQSWLDENIILEA